MPVAWDLLRPVATNAQQNSDALRTSPDLASARGLEAVTMHTD